MSILMLQTRDRRLNTGCVLLNTFVVAAEAARSEEEPPLDKYGLLINYLAPSVYAYVEDVSSYEEGIGILKRAYVRP